MQPEPQEEGPEEAMDRLQPGTLKVGVCQAFLLLTEEIGVMGVSEAH